MTRFITATKNTIAADRFGRCDKGLGQSNPWTYRGQTKGDLACVRTGTPLVTKVWWSSFGTGRGRLGPGHRCGQGVELVHRELADRDVDGGLPGGRGRVSP
jgi:hypothetical protein